MGSPIGARPLQQAREPEIRGAGISRRDFIRSTALWLGGLASAFITAPSLAFLLSPALRETEQDGWILLGPLDAFPPNEPVFRQFTRTSVNGWERTAASYGLFVVRTEATSARVFSNVCTHLGCHVNWRPDLGHYVSPCHDGHFDILGNTISGPPPRPLDEFRTRIEAQELYVELPPVRRTSNGEKP